MNAEVSKFYLSENKDDKKYTKEMTQETKPSCCTNKYDAKIHKRPSIDHEFMDIFKMIVDKNSSFSTLDISKLLNYYFDGELEKYDIIKDVVNNKSGDLFKKSLLKNLDFGQRRKSRKNLKRRSRKTRKTRKTRKSRK